MKRNKSITIKGARVVLTIVALMSFDFSYSQSSTLNAEFSASLIASSQDQIPFWLRANTSFQYGDFTNVSGHLAGVYDLNLKNIDFEMGAYLFARDGVETNIQRRDIYIKATHKWFKATIGAKQNDVAFFGLSSTNQNYLLSNNARPLPGILIEANNPIKISNSLSLDWGIAHYQLNDDRFVDDTRIHYKRLKIFTSLSQNSKITLGIQHFAQWAGTSTTLGDLNDGLGAYWDVFLAKKPASANSDNEARNALGNHLGTYLVKYNYKSTKGELTLYHEHPFEDGSGTRLQNFPDGVWGVTYQFTSPTKILKGLLYEYTDTRSQSGTASTSGRDNYFRNKIYRSGWTYEQNIIGTPFFRVDKTLGVNSGVSPIIGNRFQVHHVGIHGDLKSVLFFIKASYSKNIGNYSPPFEVAFEDIYFSAEAKYLYKLKHHFSLILGADVSNITDSIFASGISYKYKF